MLVLYRHAIWDTPIFSDISSCYRSIGVDKKSQLLRILFWFVVDEESGTINLDKPAIYRRDNVDFGHKPASVITEVCLGKFCARACLTTEGAELLRDKRYADDIGYSLRSELLDRSDGKQRFLAVRQDLIKACKEYRFTIKLVLSTWDTDPSLMDFQCSLIFNPEDKKERFLGQK